MYINYRQPHEFTDGAICNPHLRKPSRKRTAECTLIQQDKHNDAKPKPERGFDGN